MFIYLKDDTKTNSLILKNRDERLTIFGREILNHGGILSVGVPDEPEFVSEKFKDVFFRASILAYPNYHKIPCKRVYGKYKFGKAEAELLFHTENHPYVLTLYTDYWDGLNDMAELQIKLLVGDISPIKKYGGEQRKRFPIEILKEIISSKKLSKVQRFILALRLTTSTKPKIKKNKSIKKNFSFPKFSFKKIISYFKINFDKSIEWIKKFFSLPKVILSKKVESVKKNLFFF